MPWNLFIEGTDDQRVAGPFDESHEISIGRELTNDVVLTSREVSRQHLRVKVNGETITIQDSSANGTLAGRHVVHHKRVRIPPNTSLRVGPFKLRVMLDGEERPLASQSAPPASAAPSREKHDAVSSTIVPDAMPLAPPSPDDATAAPGPGVEVAVEVRRKMHRMLLDHLNLASLDRDKMNDAKMRINVRAALRRIMVEVSDLLPPGVDTAQLIDDLTDEALGLGPLEKLLSDPSISEIMVVDPTTIYVERSGRIYETGLRFTDDETVRAVIERIVTPLGRRIDESTPLVDARLKDGSRVNAIIPPLALRGPCITIRRFSKVPLTIDKLIGFGAMTEQMATFLTRSVVARKNVVVSGGTGSGKTTLLNILSGSIPDHERIVTIEDAAELQLAQSHVVSLESRPPNMEGKGEYSIRDLVRNALRMRPDRIVVGECRGGEALDMLQAMNTGHDGSMTTTHANSPAEALKRLETLALMSGLDLPARAIREQIATAVNLVVQQTRFSSDGSRRVTSVTEVIGLDDEGEFETHEIFGFFRTGTAEDGKVIGEFRASGYMPSFIDQFISLGLVKDGRYL